MTVNTMHQLLPLVSLLLLNLPTTTSKPKTVTVPTDTIRSPKQIADILGEAPPAPDAPDGFSWSAYGGDINVSTSILFPLEGATVGPNFEVMIEIAAQPLGGFKERYKDASHCLSIDDEPPACWTILEGDGANSTAILPRFVNVPRGPHTLRAGVTDPSGEWVLPDSWSTLRRFTVGDPKAPEGQGNELVTEEDAAEEPPQEDEDDIKLDIPRIRIDTPPEMSVITTHFIDMTYSVLTPDPEAFNKHFKWCYACGSLDGGAHACWPLFNVSHNPRWLGVGQGVHTLQTAVTHPNSGDEVEGSHSELRAFIIYTDEEFHDAVVAKGMAIDDGKRSTSSNDNADGEGGEFDDDKEDPGLDQHVILDIDIGHRLHTDTHVTYKLPVQRGADFPLVGARFCAARGVGNAECVENIVREIYAKFKEVDAAAAVRAAARFARRKAKAEEASRTIPTPEGEGFLIIPVLGRSSGGSEGQGGGGGDDAGAGKKSSLTAELDGKMREALDVCKTEHDAGDVGLECLTQQSLLFGMRDKLEPTDQEALLDFIGNLGAGFGF